MLAPVRRPIAKVYKKSTEDCRTLFSEYLTPNLHAVIEPRIGKDLKKRYDCPRFGIQAAENQTLYPGIDQCTSAHRTRLLRHIQSAFNSPRTKLRCRVAKRDDFSVSRRVDVHFTSIVSGRNQSIVDHHCGSDRHISCYRRLFRLRQRYLHPFPIIAVIIAGSDVIPDLIRLHRGSERGRTSNPRLRRPVLYPLSYGSKKQTNHSSRLY